MVSAWHGEQDAAGRRLQRVDLFTIDNGVAPFWGGTFQTVGASYVMPETDKSIQAGVYTLRQAARRIRFAYWQDKADSVADPRAVAQFVKQADKYRA